MKLLSYFFVGFAFVCTHAYATPVFKFAELKESSSFTIPADSKKENSFGGSGGVRLVCGESLFSLDARSYVTLPKTKFSAIRAWSSPAAFSDALYDVRYGAGMTIGKTVPLTLKAGMISFSRAVSRLQNPAPSATANPLTKSFGFSSGIGANLPTLSSAEKPLTVFASAVLPQAFRSVPITLQVAYNEEKTSLASASVTIRPSKFISLQSAITAGHFLVSADTKTKKLLLDTNAFFTPSWLYSASIETAFRSPFAKANLFVGFQQSPFSEDFSPYMLWVQSAVRTTFRNLLVDASYFAIPTLSGAPRPVPLIGASSSVCRTIQQVGINPQVQFELANTSNATIRLGIHAIVEKKILDTNEAEQYSMYKWKFGLAYETKPFTAKFTAGVQNVILDGRFLTISTTPDQYYSFDASSSLSLASVKAALSLSYDRYPKSDKTGIAKDTVSTDISISPGKARILTLTSGAHFSYKNGEKSSSSAESSATLKLKNKKLRTTIKCAVAIPL